jgi:O-antigen biosynthesis protein
MSAERPTGGDADQERLASALGWLADRLVEATDDSGEPTRSGLSWDLDAGSFPPAYWHWIHVWDRFWTEHPEADTRRGLPTRGPVLSVVVPVYRPALWYFRECVQSVIDQSYQDWELCLCDDGSDDPELTEAMAAFALQDTRITSLALDANQGISHATNRALAAATGEFVVFMDHDDVLEPESLAEIAAAIAADDDVDVVYTDEDKLDELGRRFQPHFKPDWDPELLLAYPYLNHLTAIRRELMTRIGGLRPEFDGSQDYDVMLRATELARRIVHIPKVLYHWRAIAGSAAADANAKEWAHQASRRVVEETVRRRGIRGHVETGPFPGAYHVRRDVDGSPTVSIIIPFRDQASLTVACIDSLDRDPGHPIHELVFIDNGSTEPETRALRSRLESRPDTRVLDYPGAFNWAAINNQAAATCTSDMLLFLNNDIEATEPGWLHAMVELAQRPEVGAVGARLVYPDGKLQHAGVTLGLSGVAGHLFVGMPKGERGYFAWDRVVRSYSAVTAACMLVRREVFEEVGGFNEDFAVAFNDVDFCIRVARAGYRLLYTPHAELTHYESISRGLSGFQHDYQEFLRLWSRTLAPGDPFYNPNLSRLESWCSLRMPGEDEEWLERVGGLVDHGLELDGAVATGVGDAAGSDPAGDDIGHRTA